MGYTGRPGPLVCHLSFWPLPVVDDDDDDDDDGDDDDDYDVVFREIQEVLVWRERVETPDLRWKHWAKPELYI